MKTKLRTIVIAGLLLGILAACAAPATPPPAPTTPAEATVPPEATAPPAETPPPAGVNCEGVTLVAVTQPGPYIAGPLFDHREVWTARTGGQVEVVEVPYEDLYAKIMTSFTTGVHAYDIVVAGATWLPDFAAYLVPLDDYIADPATNPTWDDILPAFREVLAKWDGHYYALTLDGDTHTLFYRRSIFEDADNKANFQAEYGYALQVPTTMEQLRDVAEFFTGWDWNGDGQNDYGWAQPMARGTQSHWWFWNYAAPYCVMPPGPEGPDRYHGQLYFDPETMEPLINQPCMLKALELYKELTKFGPPGMVGWGASEQISAFGYQANVAMEYEWASFPGQCEDPAYAGPGVQYDCGSAVRAGSMEVWDRENQEWVELEEPNTAPLLAFGGWLGSVTKTSPNLDCAYDFLKFMNSPEISMQDVVVGDTGFNVYRYSQIENIDAWIEAWGEGARQDAEEYLAAVEADLENPNVLIDLRIPGKPEYVDTVLDLHVSSAISGEEDPAAALQTIYNEWEKITDRLGREQQKEFYRAMMGMD